jgi:hypothetical protein
MGLGLNLVATQNQPEARGKLELKEQNLETCVIELCIFVKWVWV